MTPQINHLRKMRPVLRVSTYIYRVSKKIDGKTFIFRVNLGMWPLKSIVSEKWALFWGLLTHMYGVSKEINGQTIIFRVNLGMWPLKLIISFSIVITLQMTIFRSMSSLQYTICRCQGYICSAVKLSQFLQYLPKYAL